MSSNVFYPSAAERVDMERNNNVRLALRLLTADHHEKIGRTQIREHVVTIMLDSVHRQARWSAGLETTSG